MSAPSRNRSPRPDGPPLWLEAILARALPTGLSGQATLGDLAEEYGRRARRSRLRARAWYLAQTVSIVTHIALVEAREGMRSGARPGTEAGADLRWTARSLARHPGFGVGVVAILGLGIGAVTGVYAVVDGTLRNTSWWADADVAVAVWPEREFSFGMLQLYREDQTAYRTVGGYTELAFSLRPSGGESRSVNGVAITPALFRELAVQPRLGRPLADDDALVGVEPVVVLGEALWRSAFGGDPSVVGRRVDLAGAPTTVVGIQGPGGNAPGGEADLWVPLIVDPRDDDYFRTQNLHIIGMLRPGASLDDAFRELSAYNERLSDMFPAFFPPDFGKGLERVERADANHRRRVRTPLALLLGGTALLLLVTALNVGNLLLGRAIERRRELSVRAALGAGRGRIARQLIVEGTVLTTLALATGLGIAALGAPWLAGLFVGENVVASSSVLSPRILAFALVVAGAAWLVLNGVTVFHFLRTHGGGLRPSVPSGTGVRRALVAVQAGLATLLLVSASLLVATVDNLRRVPLGFEPGRLLAVELSPPEDRVATVSRGRDLFDRLVDRAKAVPGVEAAGLTGWLPLRTQAPETPINLEAAPVQPMQATKAPLHRVDPGFFATLGITASEGRLLDNRDRADRPSAVVVNRTLADRLWPEGGAVGQRIAIDPHAWNRWVPVVGVVPDIRSGEITRPADPAIYAALSESPARNVTLVVRTAPGAPDARAALRGAIRDVDPLVPVRSIRTMPDVVRSAYATAWVMMGLLVVLALASTVLGAVGVYAVMAHHVSASRREIGVRMALGALPRTVVGHVVRAGLAIAGVGIAAGCVAAALTSRVLESLLFEVDSLAPAAYVGTALGLAIVVMLAAWIPALRAGRLQPSEVLRTE